LNGVTGETYRLPTEAEWEYAAKGNVGLDQFGWGNQFEQGKANCKNCGSAWDGSGTIAVGSFEANPFGLYDMHGNVWEVTANCFSLTYRENLTSHTLDEEPECKSIVVRGGSWDTRFDEIKTWYRAGYSKHSVSNDVGFRLVKELP
jgi:formylglycine-generating enzyme required for sulfatase activity